MGKIYQKVNNDQRKELIRLIHIENYSISQAAKELDIYYPTAKAINKVYRKENRSQKREFRFRAKILPGGQREERKLEFIERLKI
jgi:transposase